MQKMDATSKELFSNPKFAASFCNAVFAKGARAFKAKSMKLVNTEQPTVEEEENGALWVDSRYRDLLFDVVMTIGKTKYRMLIGFEFQSTPDCTILLRAIGYDERTYRMQLRYSRRNGRLVPVFSVVVYTGEKPWNPKRELADMLGKSPAFMNDFRPNYSIIFIDLRRISDAIMKNFCTELKFMVNCLRLSDAMAR